MCRAFLFENYSEMDKEMIQEYETIHNGRTFGGLFGGGSGSKTGKADDGGKTGGLISRLFGGGKKK